MNVYHKPVLVDHVVRSLEAAHAKVVFDATLGDGGYAEAILRAMPSSGKLYGIDRDPQALARARKRLAVFSDRFSAIEGNFADLEHIASKAGVEAADGIVADLGVSYLQISDPGRGFMFSKSGPLSMQMGQDAEFSAEDVVNTFSEKELARIIKMYGEERGAKRIARAIVARRNNNKIETTKELADIVRSVVSSRFAVKSLARVFQAIRIFVNKELDSLDLFLPQALQLLRKDGYLIVLSYHSLEDRKVKSFMHKEQHPCTCPPDLPVCVCGKKPRLQIIGKMIRPSSEEAARNPNSRSAKMRIARKL
ncbi:MAG: 16S rRNA (cytosine(1402)-N(4))-methyltransferase RsmH [Calditrichaeota bacterium]|nr:16S rRNA (cytosine(1402)-N(4))-methyltransferase RsmH [Calditrichota bacterium]